MKIDKQEIALKINNLKEKILARQSAIKIILESKYNLNIEPIPIYLDLKGRKAGVFSFLIRKIELRGFKLINHSDFKIRYNLKHFIENEEDFLLNTVAHEYCHYVCYLLEKKEGKSFSVHGKEWKEMMRFLGLTPSRTHSYNVQAPARYKYNCNCSNGVFVGKIIHKKIMTKKARYLCARCKKVLVKDISANDINV